MRTFVPDRTCWSLLLTTLAISLRNKPTYDKLRVLVINKDVRKSLARKNGNENPIWSWNDSKARVKAQANDGSVKLGAANSVARQVTANPPLDNQLEEDGGDLKTLEGYCRCSQREGGSLATIERGLR